MVDSKMSEYLYFDEAMFKRFKRVYKRTLLAQRQSFTFEGHDVLCSYAKYVIQYIETELKKNPEVPLKKS